MTPEERLLRHLLTLIGMPEDMQEKLMQQRNATPVTIEMTEKNVDIVREGKVIVIPEGMKLGEAREWLARKEKSEEENVNVFEQVEAFPLDGAYAFTKALSRIYGWVDLQPTPGFWGPTPPAMVGMEVGIGKSVQVPWGQFAIPNVEGHLNTAFAVKDGRLIFAIRGMVKRKNLDDVAKIAKLTREIVKAESVYRGKAIAISFPEDEDEFDPNAAPEFFDTSAVREEELVFPKEVEDMVGVNLFTPIEHTAACREHQIPLKRGILLEGPYGVGKTLTADVTAKKAVENGWTFIYLDDVRKLQRAIYFAQQYQPAVIFAEDIDRVLKGERTSEMDAVLNTIDGVDTKHNEIMVVLTTNHVDDINKAGIRPGRLDAVIPVRPPDADAVGRLIRLYSRTLLPAGEDISAACNTLAGQIPAVIREVVERSKLSAIRRRGPTLTLKGEDLELAAKSMMAHVKLMATKVKDTRSDVEKAAGVLASALSGGRTQQHADAE